MVLRASQPPSVISGLRHTQRAGEGGQRETNRQADRQAGSQTDRQAGRQTHTDTHRDTDRDRQTQRQRETQREELVTWYFEPSQPQRDISGLRERQTDRQTDRQRGLSYLVL